MYLRSFYLVNKGKEWPVQGNLSILPDAVLVDGSNMLTGHPSTGVISRECVKAFIADPGNRYLVAFSLFLTENASVCLRFRFKPVVPNSFDLTFSFQVQDNGLPVCDTTHHLPSVHLGNTGATSPATRYQCASAGVIPADLVQKPAFTHCGLRAVDRIVPCYVGFNSGGWFVDLLHNQSDYINCALSTTSLPPAQAGIPGVSALWQIAFGDPHSSTNTACGWWARVGNNLTYVVHWDVVMACPTTMFNNSARVEVVGYWAEPSPSPVPTQTPTRTATQTLPETPSPSSVPSQSWSPTQSPTPTPSSSQAPRSTPAAAFSFLGLSGPSAVGAVVGVSVSACVLAVALGFFVFRRYVVGGVSYAKLSVEAGAGRADQAEGGSLNGPSGYELGGVPPSS